VNKLDILKGEIYMIDLDDHLFKELNSILLDIDLYEQFDIIQRRIMDKYDEDSSLSWRLRNRENVTT